MNWQDNLIVDAEGIRDLLARTKRIAVLGMRTEAYAFKPAFYVPEYLEPVSKPRLRTDKIAHYDETTSER